MLSRVLFATGVSIWMPELDMMDFFRPATEAMAQRARRREEGEAQQLAGKDSC